MTKIEYEEIQYHYSVESYVVFSSSTLDVIGCVLSEVLPVLGVGDLREDLGVLTGDLREDLGVGTDSFSC